jgi:hypothetical protein
MWIEGHISTVEDWSVGIFRYEGYDPELDGDVSYLTFGFILFSISLVFPKK